MHGCLSQADSRLCQQVYLREGGGRIPSNGQGLKVAIYLTGKANCKSNADTNAWMDPLKKAEVCCAVVPFYDVVGCQKGVEKWCRC